MTAALTTDRTAGHDDAVEVWYSSFLRAEKLIDDAYRVSTPRRILEIVAEVDSLRKAMEDASPGLNSRWKALRKEHEEITKKARRLKSAQLRDTWKKRIGEKVKSKPDDRPRYAWMNDAVGVLKKVNRTTASVDYDSPHGVWKVPLGDLLEVDHEG